MSYRGRAGAILARFRADSRAGLSIALALLLIPLVGFIAAGIDYGRAVRSKARIGEVADAAALAATKYAADADAKTGGQNDDQIISTAEDVAKKYFTSGLASLKGETISAPTVTVSKVKGVWSTQIHYSATVKTPFGKFVGVSAMSIGGTASARIDPGLPVLDITMCVDSTGSMQPTLDTVKANALAFYDNLNAEIVKKGIPAFPLVRVRMIYFKDYGGFGTATASMYGVTTIGDPDPMNASNFFALPDQSSSFDAFVSPQTAYGGGDTPESGLECLNTAIDSQWMKVGDVPSGFSQAVTDVYPIVVIWTDAPAHLPSYPDSLANPLYPDAATMPRDFAGLLAKWNDPKKIAQAHKQIVFFGDPNVSAPDNYGGMQSGWTTVETWPGFTVGGGLTEANASMVQLLATGIASGAHGLRVSQ